MITTERGGFVRTNGLTLFFATIFRLAIAEQTWLGTRCTTTRR